MENADPATLLHSRTARAFYPSLLAATLAQNRSAEQCEEAQRRRFRNHAHIVKIEREWRSAGGVEAQVKLIRPRQSRIELQTPRPVAAGDQTGQRNVQRD